MSLQRLPHSRHGFTLPEILVGSLIVTILGIVLGTLARAATEGIGMINTTGSLQTQLSNAADFLMKDASLAIDATNTCCPTGSYTAAADSHLILRLYSVGTNGQTLNPSLIDYIIYELNTSFSTPMLRRIVEARPESARSISTYAWNLLPLVPTETAPWPRAFAVTLSDWLFPSAEAGADCCWGPLPPPPMGVERQNWVAVKQFRFSVDQELVAGTPGPATGTKYVHVELSGELRATSGHLYSGTRRFRAIFLGPGGN